jgi:hypothetical protein
MTDCASLIARKTSKLTAGQSHNYRRATADSVAQVDLVNVAKGFRETQKLQIVKFTQRSEIL